MKEQRRQWGYAHPVSYRYEFRETCFCAPDTNRHYRVEVERGRETALPLDAPAGDMSAFDPDPVMSIGRLFRIVEDAIVTADELSVEYDPVYGFPASVAIDPSQAVADDERYLYVSDFRPAGER